MKIVVHVPFGAQSQESGLIYLLANYIKDIYPETRALRCNGIFSLCDRDAERTWSRNVDSCLACMSEQKASAHWASLGVQDLSMYLEPKDLEETRRWLTLLPEEQYLQAEYRGIRVFDLCRGSFMNRFGIIEPDLKNKNHLQFAGRLMLSALRMALASQRYVQEVRPDMSFVAGGSDFITMAYLAQLGKQKRNAARFQWDLHERCVRISTLRGGSAYSCSLVPEGLDSIRPDCRTWSPEVVHIVREILRFLDIAEDQLELPMAR